jgi:hypothetical protein
MLELFGRVLETPGTDDHTLTDYADVTRKLTDSSKGLAALGPHTEVALRHLANLGLR